MTQKRSDTDATYSEAETEARREAALKRMLNTPHKPREKPKGGMVKSSKSGSKTKP